MALAFCFSALVQLFLRKTCQIFVIFPSWIANATSSQEHRGCCVFSVADLGEEPGDRPSPSPYIWPKLRPEGLKKMFGNRAHVLSRNLDLALTSSKTKSPNYCKADSEQRVLFFSVITIFRLALPAFFRFTDPKAGRCWWHFTGYRERIVDFVNISWLSANQIRRNIFQ